MILNELLSTVKPLAVVGQTDIDITGVNIDSRRIKEGHLFVAQQGTQVDGHKFIPKALEPRFLFLGLNCLIMSKKRQQNFGVILYDRQADAVYLLIDI